MKYYIDENNKLYEKSGVDYRVSHELRTLEGLRIATDEEAALILNPPPTEDQLAQQAQSEMITELNWCDLQLKYHATGDTKRAISTTELINAYAVDCRDYVQNVDGVLTIVGDKPERPE